MAQSFGPPIEIASSEGEANHIELADLDGDGFADVICATKGANKISWFKNIDGEHFSGERILNVSANGAECVFAADLDGDGDLDVLSASEYDGKIAWYENLGSGNFGAEQVLDLEAQGAMYVFAEDLDQDGDLDVLSASAGDNKVSWYENLNNGNFGPRSVLSSTAVATTYVSASDLDEDGDQDIIITAPGQNKIVWLENNGGADFQDEQIITSNLTSPQTACIEDVNGDGFLDVLSTSFIEGIPQADLVWFANDGTGGFGLEQTLFSGVSHISAIQTADIDGDGDEDVLAASWIDNQILLIRNYGNAVFGNAQILDLEADGPMSLAMDDIDNDGDLDLGFAASNDNNFSVSFNNGSGVFQSPVALNAYPDGIYDIHSEDLDSDGEMDLLFASQTDNTVGWYRNLGDGNFAVREILTDSLHGARSVFSADMDGDGDLDVLATGVYAGRVVWFENDGDGVFGPEILVSSDLEGPNYIYAADLDNDGDMDVICGSRILMEIAWFENNGQDGFSEKQVISATDDYSFTWIIKILPIDLDDDGDLDLVCGIWNSTGSIFSFENLGNGTFGPLSLIGPGNEGVITIFSADFDNDGDQDLASARTSLNIDRYENDGTGTLVNREILDFGGLVSGGDVDLDGDIDLVCISSATVGGNTFRQIFCFKNEGGGNFQPKIPIVDIASTDVNRDFLLTDMDGDGDLDVVLTFENANSIAWHENFLGEGCMDETACNYDSSASIANTSICCFGICGCTDPLAENYLDVANCDNGTCQYIEGCTQETASNFNAEATLDDGSCLFEITGLVFYDGNANGEFDEEDYGLAGQEVFAQSLGLSFITNSSGVFTTTLEQQYANIQFELNNSSVFPEHTTWYTQMYSSSDLDQEDLLFGVREETEVVALTAFIIPSSDSFLCSDLARHYVFVRNEGNVTFNGIVAFQYDDLFQSHLEVSPIDSIQGNSVFYSFDNLAPGAIDLFEIKLMTPTTDFIGEITTNSFTIDAFVDGEVVLNQDGIHEMIVACAYDPNDKQVFSENYTDENWILQESEQVFHIRFQNTGNAPAQDVLVQDTIDTHFDLSTFRFIANSHSVSTSINEDTRVVDFLFQDIQLPDSTSNEPQSHGFISFAITPEPDLPVGEDLNNRAFIYFDNNPPIITNTTLATIHECGGESAFNVSNLGVCVSDTAFFASTYEALEEYNWSIDDMLVGNEDDLVYVFTEAGSFEVQLAANNPLCSDTTNQTVVVYSTPDASFVQEDGVLICNAGDSYQWFLNGEAIENAQSQEYEPTEDGDYSVMVTNGGVCSAMSEEVVIVGVENLDEDTVALYPNPMSEVSILSFYKEANRQISLFDVNGKEVRRWENIASTSVEIHADGLASGQYVLHVMRGSQTTVLKLVVR